MGKVRDEFEPITVPIFFIKKSYNGFNGFNVMKNTF